MRGSPNNIEELIAALKGLGSSVLSDDKELYDFCREVFTELGRMGEFDPSNVDKIIKYLESLPPEIKEEEIDKFLVENKEKNKALNEKELEELIRDYEEARGKREKEEAAREISFKTGEDNVDKFIQRLKEASQKAKEKGLEELTKEYKDDKKEKAEKIAVEKEIYIRSGTKEVEKVVEKMERVVAERGKEISQLSPELKEEIVVNLVKIETEQGKTAAERVEKIIFEENKGENANRLKKEIKNKEAGAEIFQRIEEIKAEIVVEKKAEEIYTMGIEKLKEEGVVVNEKKKEELKKEVLKAWREGEKLEIPQGLVENGRKELVLREIEKATEIFKENNLETVVNYRAAELRKEVSQELRREGVRDEGVITDFTKTVNELTNNPKVIVAETNRSEISDVILSKNPKASPGEIERAIDEAKFIVNNVAKTPKKLNALLEKYDQLREKIGSDKLPKIKEIRVLDKMAALFKNNPGALKLFNGAQKVVGAFEKISNFPGSLLARIGAKEVGYRILGKIGGQAAVELVKNAALIISKEGTVNGIRMIAQGLITKGAVAADIGVSGALTGVITAFQALPVVGQIVAVVAAVVLLAKPIIDKIKNWFSDKLNLNLNWAKKFISEDLGLGNFVGGVGQFLVDIGTFLIGIPALLGAISLTALITPVVIFFALGTMAFSMFQQSQVSPLVPPAGQGNCVLKSQTSGTINCDENAPENSVSGVNKEDYIQVANKWKNESNNASRCYNDTVNRALCGGINPTYVLWTWLHESDASNYSIDNVEDFGIHGLSSVPAKNYDSQINYFLTTDYGSACPELNDYWLSFSTKYLTGGCDPDKKHPITGLTGRDYLKEMQETWAMVSSVAMPTNIKVAKAGKNCDQIGKNTVNYEGNSKEITDSEGRVWICTENTQSPQGDYDPNSPGLAGVTVDGECSVGEVVVPTKQCDPQWANMTLSGESCGNGSRGTICSAGCGPTSVSMLMRHVNGSMTPNNVIFGSGSAYAMMGCNGSSLSQAYTELTKKFGSSGVTYNDVTLSCDEKAIANWICNGKVVMVLANFYRNSNLDLGGHFVLAIGVQNGKIVVQDPYYDSTKTPFDGGRAYGYAHDIQGCLLVDKEAVK